MTRIAAFRWGWAAFIVIATSAPHVLHWLSTPAGYHYTWILPPYPEDSFAYMAWARQAADGAWLFKVKFTALPHEAFLFHPFFLICGWMSWIFSCDIGVVFWALKAVGAGLLLATFFRYIDYLGLSTTQSVVASILLGVSSGFGGILAFLGWIDQSWLVPADLWMPDVTTFWSLLWNPLFPFSLTLMLLSIFWLDRGTRDERASDLWRSGLATGLLALTHPYAIPLLFALAGIITMVRKRTNAAGYLVRYFAAALPFAIYLALVSQTNSLVSRHSVLGEMKSPHIAAYALGFGIPLLLCVTGLIVERAQLLKRYWYILLWFFLAVTCAYLPFWFQRKLIFGAHIPLCIVGGVVFGSILDKWSSTAKPKRVAIVVAVILLPLLASTPLFVLANQNKEVKTNADGVYFMSKDMMEGLKVLRERSEPDDVVFARLQTSLLIPAFTGSTTVWGHWAMSIDYADRVAWMDNLFGAQSNLDDENRSREFWGSDIQFIFADGEVKQSLEQYPLAWRIILRDAKKVFENDSVVIYQHYKVS